LSKGYELEETLGEGEFGKVKLAVHKPTRAQVAIKIFKRSRLDEEEKRQKLQREIHILNAVVHHSIVRLFEVLETDELIGLVIEYASGGELFDYILAHRYLSEPEGGRLFAQLIDGVHYLHSKNVVHRDLKLENLLLSSCNDLIIIDFGFANQFPSGPLQSPTDDDPVFDVSCHVPDRHCMMATSCGSPCYAAPELVIADGYIGTVADVWSCGVILFAMLAGYLPFDDDPANPHGDNITLLYKYILSEPTPLNFPAHVSESARDLIRRMLTPDPEKRVSVHEVIRHPWLTPFTESFSKDYSSPPPIPAKDEIFSSWISVGTSENESPGMSFQPSAESKADSKIMESNETLEPIDDTVSPKATSKSDLNHVQPPCTESQLSPAVSSGATQSSKRASMAAVPLQRTKEWLDSLRGTFSGPKWVRNAKKSPHHKGTEKASDFNKANAETEEKNIKQSKKGMVNKEFKFSSFIEEQMHDSKSISRSESTENALFESEMKRRPRSFEGGILASLSRSLRSDIEDDMNFLPLPSSPQSESRVLKGYESKRKRRSIFDSLKRSPAPEPIKIREEGESEKTHSSGSREVTLPYTSIYADMSPPTGEARGRNKSATPKRSRSLTARIRNTFSMSQKFHEHESSSVTLLPGGYLSDFSPRPITDEVLRSLPPEAISSMTSELILFEAKKILLGLGCDVDSFIPDKLRPNGRFKLKCNLKMGKKGMSQARLKAELDTLALIQSDEVQRGRKSIDCNRLNVETDVFKSLEMMSMSLQSNSESGTKSKFPLLTSDLDSSNRDGNISKSRARQGKGRPRRSRSVSLSSNKSGSAIISRRSIEMVPPVPTIPPSIVSTTHIRKHTTHSMEEAAYNIYVKEHPVSLQYSSYYSSTPTMTLAASSPPPGPEERTGKLEIPSLSLKRMPMLRKLRSIAFGSDILFTVELFSIPDQKGHHAIVFHRKKGSSVTYGRLKQILLLKLNHVEQERSYRGEP
jgi:serine/threonine protein kinase